MAHPGVYMKMKLFTSLLILMSAAASIHAENLYPVNLFGQWGYINASGKIICEPQFDYAYPFSGGMGKVMSFKNDTAWFGFVDLTGRVVFSPRFEAAQDFNNGFCRVSIQDKWGIIDSSGKVLLEPALDEIWDFSEGMAVYRSQDRYGFLDQTGSTAIPADFLWAGSFHEGLAVVKTKVQDPSQYFAEEKYGYLTRKGTYYHQPVYKQAKPYFSSRAGVIFPGDSAWSFMDQYGRALTNLRYAEIGHFQEGMARVRSSYYWGFIDENGREVIPPTFSLVGDFSGGLALVNKGSWSENGEYRGGKWGVINKKGQAIVEPLFDSITPFFQGTAVVWKDRKPGLLYINGNYDISTNFNWIYPFREGLARVETRKRFGFINTRGQLVFKPVFLAASDFYQDLCLVLTRTDSIFTLSYITRNGAAVWNLDYDITRPFKKDDVVRILAYPGLDLKKTPEAEGKTVYTIPYGEAVTVLSGMRKTPVAADGMVGRWIEVEYKGAKGFLFHPYLTKLPAPVPGMGLEEYFNKKMGVINPLASFQNQKREVFHYAAVRETEVYYSRLQSEYTVLGPDIQEMSAVIKAALGFAHMPIPDSFASLRSGPRYLSMTVTRPHKYQIDKIVFSYTIGDKTEQIVLSAPSPGLIKIVHHLAY